MFEPLLFDYLGIGDQKIGLGLGVDLSPGAVTPGNFEAIVLLLFLGRKFYVCSWKKKTQTYNLESGAPFPRPVGRKGIHLMVCTTLPLVTSLFQMGCL